MARPFKSGVDYFPLDVKMDDEVELLESEHNLVGFAVLIKLYQRIYDNNYWIKWDKKELIVFSKRVNVDKNEVNAIIDTCLEWGILDKNLFDKYSILTSKGIQKRFFEIVKRRSQIEIVEEFLLINIPTREKQEIVIVDINLINECKSTQSKVKESKVKESKKTKINKPENVTDQTWNDFISHRKSKKAPITKTVINTFLKESVLAGMSLEDALIESITRGWRGFKAEWVKSKIQLGGNNWIPIKNIESKSEINNAENYNKTTIIDRIAIVFKSISINKINQFRMLEKEFQNEIHNEVKQIVKTELDFNQIIKQTENHIGDLVSKVVDQ